MPSASKKAPVTKESAKTITEAPAKVEKAAKVERVEGDVFASEHGHILRQTANGLQILFSNVPTTNIHPGLYTPEQYEAKIAETYGELTKIYPTAK